ncbi:sensor histidine kinase, partial [Streptomyces sp. NPDC049577]
LRHGPRAGGFLVTARLPHVPARRPAPGPAPAPAAEPLPPEHRRARRRAKRTLAAAIAVPLLTLAALSGALVLWSSLTLSHAVLDPAVYASLYVGQNRREVEPLLPDRQLPYRPRMAEPAERGAECLYYAVTADRFVSASGHAYRLCFRDGRLTGFTVLKG